MTVPGLQNVRSTLAVISTITRDCPVIPFKLQWFEDKQEILNLRLERNLIPGTDEPFYYFLYLPIVLHMHLVKRQMH